MKKAKRNIKRFSLVLAAVLLIVLAAGCSANYDTAMGNSTGISTKGVSASESYSFNEYSMDMAKSESGGMYDDYGEETENSELGNGIRTSLNEKIIYSARAEIETTDFENAVQRVYDVIDNYGAFLESSYVTGKNYRAEVFGYQTYRYAEFIIRVPAAGYNSLTSNLGVFGNVTSLNSWTDNITEQYYDVQSRLDTYEIEEDRLLSMLEKADNVSDMIALESRLSDIRYSIEALESKLRNWQNQLDYSTVTIMLNEVEELTPIVETQRSYWQELTDGFAASMKAVGRFFKNLFRDIIIALPQIVTFLVFAAAAIIILWIIFGRKARARRREKRDLKKQSDTEEKED